MKFEFSFPLTAAERFLILKQNDFFSPKFCCKLSFDNLGVFPYSSAKKRFLAVPLWENGHNTL